MPQLPPLGGYKIAVNTITPGITDTPPILSFFPARRAQQQERALKR
jgi:NAD(P)-dependent dehydrogenase (short-subunit alcohol dehydrogenase family)